LEIKITQLAVDRIQANIDAELLSKDCTEKMTNTEIVPAPETPGPVPETPAPAPEIPTPVPENTNNNDVNELKVGIDVAANLDPKFVCKSGCNNSQDAKSVLNLRVNLENELKPCLDHFYADEVPTACEEKSASLLDGVLSLLSGLQVIVRADANANN
jgi:hypothetical protein